MRHVFYKDMPGSSSSLTKGYDPVHIPSLHPWYISRFWDLGTSHGKIPGERHLTEVMTCFP